jgi:hypothetical protein
LSLDEPNGRLKLNVDRLGALGEPKSLRWLRSTTVAMLPKIDSTRPPPTLVDDHGHPVGTTVGTATYPKNRL